MLTLGSLFSGIGGLELGLEWAGLGPILWQVEIDPFCRRVLAHHHPGVPCHDDVRLVGASNLAPVDVLCGGFPCQDVSSAGKGEGLAGERSGLWREFARVIRELEPRWVVVENVASGAKHWVDEVVRDLGLAGYEALPLPISAEDVGAPHRRARIFVVARRVPNPLGDEERLFEQRLSSRRSDGVCDVEASEPRDVGEQLADGGSVRWQERSGERDDACQERAPSERDGGQVGQGNPDDDRPQALRRGRLLDGERPAFGYDVDGSSGPWPWPPRPGDLDGWQDYLARGGPQPGLRRGAHGLPCGLPRAEWQARLKAFGNAVVPQCAEVVGWVIREIEGW